MISGLGIPDENALNIYTDGSSYPHKKKVSGIGMRFVWVNEQGDEEHDDYAPPGWIKADIDEMEIKACSVAVSEACKFYLDKGSFNRILMFSDSLYVVDNFVKAMNVWPKNGWRKAGGLQVENINLWKELKREVDRCPLNVEVQWVKGHAKNKHNKAADKLAKESANTPLNPPITLNETTKKWTSEKTAKGSVKIKGQAIKIRIVSREYQTKSKLTKYRYEVIDRGDEFFGRVDFLHSKEMLSRNGCYEVRLNNKARMPMIDEVLQELSAEDYKY